MITVLTGGTGGAKFVDGLRRVVPPRDLTIIVNTADDFEWWGLHVSPDLDSITYMLADMLSKERGWGVEGDTFQCLEAMRRAGQPAWFQVGDRDLSTHLLRTQFLRSGRALSEVTAEITRTLGIAARVLPMSDSPVETRVLTPDGEIHFQEYFVKRRHRDEVKAVRFVGAEGSTPAPGVVDSIHKSKAVLIAPSNPITSIGPILAVPGIREALRQTAAPVVAVSPIVGEAAVSGPAGALMEAQGLPVSAAGVAQAYADFLDVLIVNSPDAKPRQSARLQVHATNIMMNTEDDRAALARTVVALGAELQAVALPLEPKSWLNRSYLPK